MLTGVRIVNIQKHKDLDLLLDKINVIVGKTDSGKTSVLRALTWALTNDEAGENLINNEGAKGCFVAIQTEDGKVTRAWSKGNNTYSLDDKEFTTFRTGVPDPIKDLLNIDDINIQHRRDLPFMVYAKASDCANQFSAMMDLSEIDSIIANSNKSVKQHADALKDSKQRKAEVEKELETLSNLDDALTDLDELETLQMDIVKLERHVERLKNVQKQVSEASCEFANMVDPAEAEFAIQLIIEQNEEWLKTYAKRCEVFKLYDVWVDTNLHVSSLSDVNTIADNLVLVETEFADYNAVAKTLNQYQDIYNQRKHLIECEAEAMQKYLDLNTEFNDKFPKVCPLCGKEKCND